MRIYKELARNKVVPVLESEQVLKNKSKDSSTTQKTPATTFNPDESYITEDSFPTEFIEDIEVPQTSEVETNLIRISRPFRIKWDLLVMVLALYNCFTVPFFVAFYTEKDLTFFFINTLIDCVFLIDIGLNFFTTYIDSSGEEVTNKKAIRRKYLRGSFWLDLAASVPIDNFLVMFSNLESGSEIIQMSDLFKLIRILRIGRIIRYTRTRDDIKATMKLLQLTLYLIMWVHFTGCIWFLLIKSEEEWVPVPDFLTGTTQLYESDIWTKYFTCFYHAVWLLTGGEVGPRNSLQAIYACIMFIVGALITAVLFGEMAVLMSNLNRRQTQFQEILDGALTTMHNMNLPQNLMDEILDYITSTQSSLSAQEEYETFQKFISPSLQQKVSSQIYEPIISSNYILLSEDNLTDMLLSKLNNCFTKPEEEIITEGTQAKSLYFLVNGEVKITVTNRYKEKKFVCYLSEGAHFGEIGVIYNTLRTANVESVGYCTVAGLNKKDYEVLLSNYGDLEHRFRSCTDVYNDEWKQFVLSVLAQGDYFNLLPSNVFNELIYFMDIHKLQKGDYLFKPGESLNAVYIVAEGELELSMTINEKHLHLLKKNAGLSGIEKPPLVPKKNSRLEDFSNYNFDILMADFLKKKAELVPVANEKGTIGSKRIDDFAETHSIGDYPQEIVLKFLEQGSLLQPYYVLSNRVQELQCKAMKATTVYALKLETIENLAKENSDFKKEVNRIKANFKATEEFPEVLDFYSVDPQNDYTRNLFKSAVCRVILKSRESRRKGSSQIASMINKLKAIIACEEAGNFELSEKVIRGEIPPHYVQEDGTLDPAAMNNSETQSSLPRSHPIMKTFKTIFDSITQPGGEIVKQYNTIERNINYQNKKLQNFESQVERIQEKLLTLAQNLAESEEAKQDLKNLWEDQSRSKSKRQPDEVVI